MPQTLEAVDHAKAAGVPIIVAVNKIDKPESNPDRVKQQLGDRGVVPEAWGGDTIFVDVSAKKHLNLDLLLENICLTADVANLRATPGRSAVGTVVEAKLDRGRGAVASVLVQNGTLKAGDSFIVGNTFGKIRAMFDDRGRPIEEAGPSTPVEILGLEAMPDAGDTFLVVSDRDKAKGIAQYRKMKERESTLAKSSRVTLEGLADQIKQAGMKELPLIIKGDVQGSVQVLADSLIKMSTEKVAHQGHPLRRGRDHRVGRALGVGFRMRSSSASTCGLTASRPTWPSRRMWRSGCTRLFTSCRTRFARPCSGCSTLCTARRILAARRCSRSSAFRRSVRSSAAASPMACSGATPMCG